MTSYAHGTIMFIIAKREQSRTVFTPLEWLIFGVIVVAAIIGIYGLATGAIYSLAMQVREPFLDGHKGEWMMDLDLFERSFRVYWDAGYQIHVHVNGDAGLDMVLDTLEENMRRNPRHDHRTVIYLPLCHIFGRDAALVAILSSSRAMDMIGSLNPQR